MSAAETCAACRDRLPAVTVGVVDDWTAAHLIECGACRAELARWRMVARAVGVALEAAPEPSPAVLAGVWERLEAEPAVGSPARRLPGWLSHVVSLVAGQVPLVRRQLWAASAVVMAVGAVFGMTAHTADAAAGVVGLLAPAIAAVGLALVYGPEVDPGLELTLATPTSPRSVLLARMTLVLGYDLGLALAANAVVIGARGDVSWWGLISQWLGPMLLLASVALLVSVTVGTAVAVTSALTLWTVRLFTLTEAGRAVADGAVRAAVDAAWTSGPLAVAMAVALLSVAVALVGWRQRWA